MKTIHVLHAGSVIKLINNTITRFKRDDVTIQTTHSGSVDCVRRLIAGEPCDLIVLADAELITTMLMPTHTDGFYVFAGNSIAIMATSDDATINSDNWISTLLRPLSTFGHYDPFFDPGGYRAVMAFMLADHVEPGLSKKLLEHPGRMIVTPGSKPLPQFLFTYLSSAQKSGKPFVILPHEMALSKDELNPLYREVVFDLGESMVYGSAISLALTIPFTARNKELAQKFAMEFIQSDFASEGFSLKNKVVGKNPLDMV
jgi:ABC-type molybdate transport system substrate-binding protein